MKPSMVNPVPAPTSAPEEVVALPRGGLTGGMIQPLTEEAKKTALGRGLLSSRRLRIRGACASGVGAACARNEIQDRLEDCLAGSVDSGCDFVLLRLPDA